MGKKFLVVGLAITALAGCAQHPAGSGEPVDQVCRWAAEDPVLKFVDQPSQALKGIVREIVECDATCSKESTRHKFDARKRLMETVMGNNVKKYNYGFGKDTPFPQCIESLGFSESKVCYERDRAGNIIKSSDSWGNHYNFTNRMVNGEFVQYRGPQDGGVQAVWTCKNGLESSHTRFGTIHSIDFATKAMSEKEGVVKSTYKYEFHPDGTIAQQEQVMTDGGEVISQYLTRYNQSGEKTISVSKNSRGKLNLTKYQNRTYDEAGNWTSVEGCDREGKCEIIKRKISYWW